jgi:GntR family transcriptional repressor for pyruvate dehydrogenase complex
VAVPEPERALRRSAPEEVADAIRAWMFGRGMAPGDRLGREEDLARRFGVSRPTLREALRLLSSAHLIRATKGPGGGIFVAATPEQGIGHSVTDSVASMLSADSIDLEELIETRMLLEVPLAGLAAQRATEADVAALRAVLDAAGDSAQGDVFRGFDTRLHGLIAEIAGNRLARAFTAWIGQVLQPPLHVLIEPAVVDAVVVEQHRDIVRAIERGDPPAAERAMREHLVYLHDLVGAVRRAGEQR